MFTPSQDLQDVEVCFGFKAEPASYNIDFYVRVGAQAFLATSKPAGGAYAGGTVKLGNVSKNVPIDLRAMSTGGTTVINSFDNMIISARYKN